MLAKDSQPVAEAHFRQGKITLDISNADRSASEHETQSLPLSLSQAQRLAIQLMTAVAHAENGA